MTSNEFLTSGQTITFYCDEDSSAIRSVQQIELVPNCFLLLIMKSVIQNIISSYALLTCWIPQTLFIRVKRLTIYQLLINEKFYL